MGIKIIRIAVAAAVLAVCYLLLVKIPDAVAALSAAILSHSKNQLPAWGTIFLSILFGYYLLTVIFPFLLTIGWVLFTPRKRQAGSTDPFISIIIPASNEEKSILRSLQALSKIVTSIYRLASSRRRVLSLSDC